MDHRVDLKLHELVSGEEIMASQRLRYEVWRKEGAAILNPEQIIAHDEHAIHWGVSFGDMLVASARLCLHENLSDAPDSEMFKQISIQTPVASLNRLVVRNDFRRRGVSRLLDEIRLEKARELGARTVIITPINQESRRRSLTHQGFVFLDGAIGPSVWSPNILMCAGYLSLCAKDTQGERC